MINYAAKLRLFYTLNDFCVEKKVINECFCCFGGENGVESAGRAGAAASYAAVAVPRRAVAVSCPLGGRCGAGARGSFPGSAASGGAAGATACLWGRCCAAAMAAHAIRGASCVAATVSAAPGGSSCVPGAATDIPDCLIFQIETRSVLLFGASFFAERTGNFIIYDKLTNWGGVILHLLLYLLRILIKNKRR